MFRTTVFLLLLLGTIGGAGSAAEPDERELGRVFGETVAPFVQTYCQSCHGKETTEGKLDLSAYTALEKVAAQHATWQTVLQRLEDKEMPPEDAKKQPTPAERQAVITWILAVRAHDAARNAGDPGIVPARRLNAAEYNNTIRDLTGADIRPTREFPIDPANEAGFDNSGQSLAMSPALAKKYVEAARHVAEHLVLKPHGLAFAPHPAMTDTDRDKYCVNRIVGFYQRQPTDLAAYFLAAWRYKHRAELGQPEATLSEIAASEGISPRYLATVWSALADEPADVGPMAKLQAMWRELPPPNSKRNPPVNECQQIRNWVKLLRGKLEPAVKGLKVSGVHEGSQSFVLWKNRQYAANRRTYSKLALQIQGDDVEKPEPDLAVRDYHRVRSVE